MEVTIDKFGRILIPKKLRVMFGLVPGQIIDLLADKEQQQLSLRIASPQKELKVEKTSYGLPIIQNGSSPLATFDTVQFLNESRMEYLNKKMGLE